MSGDGNAPAALYLSGNAVMRFIGKRRREAFRAWLMYHRIKPDHRVGRTEYFLRAEIENALKPRGTKV